MLCGDKQIVYMMKHASEKSDLTKYSKYITRHKLRIMMMTKGGWVNDDKRKGCKKWDLVTLNTTVKDGLIAMLLEVPTRTHWCRVMQQG